MKLKYLYLLLTLIITLPLGPAMAQTRHRAKKQASKKIVKKHTPKAVAHKATPRPQTLQKSLAGSLGDQAAKISIDTTGKGGHDDKLAQGSLSEEIVVTTAYKPVLADAVKIRINPDLEDKTPFKAPLSYAPIDKRLAVDTGIKPFVAMKRPAEPDTDLTNNYLKIGAGNLKTTYGEIYINNGKDPAGQVGGYLKHFAQNGNLNKENSTNEEAGIFGKSAGDVNSISGRIDYNYKSNYFYGYNENTLQPPNLQVDKQHFSTISAEAELSKNYEDVPNAFTYDLKLKGYSFSDAYLAKESNITLSGFLNEQINQFYAGLSASLDFSTQQDSLFNYNNSIIRLNPYLKFQGESYKIEAGINLVDQFGFKSSVNIFPAAKLEFQVIPKYVRLFAEAKGDVNKSTLLGFSAINPYLGKDVTIKNSIDQLDIAVGLKGTLSPGLGFKVSVFRNEVKYMPLFVSNFNLAKGYNRFAVIYDNGQARVNGLNGEVDFKASQSVDIFGRVEVNDYQLASISQAWNLPKYKLQGGTVLHISNTVNISGTLIVRDHIVDPYPSAASPTTINAFVDLSGGVEYKATKKISVFVRANNILNTANQPWLYYPDYGFNIFGGISLGF